MPPATPAPLTGNARPQCPVGWLQLDPLFRCHGAGLKAKHDARSHGAEPAGPAKSCRGPGSGAKHAPPFSVQAAQRKLGSLLVPYPSIDRATLPRNTHFYTGHAPRLATFGERHGSRGANWTPLATPRFKSVEYSCQSQNTEDGILVYLFGVIGFTNRVGVEIAPASGARTT